MDACRLVVVWIEALVLLIGLGACRAHGETAKADPVAQHDPRDEQELAAGAWTWKRASCIGGRFRLADRRFVRHTRVHPQGAGWLFIHDQTFPEQGCAQTVVQEIVPANEPDAPWRFVERARVSLPVGCGMPRQRARRGRVHVRARRLDVAVWRSTWCSGFDAHMTYVRAPAPSRPPEEVVRHFVAHFNGQDAGRIASLFARNGDLVEPFTASSGASTRHAGRVQVRRWFAHVLEDTSWMALRLTSLQARETGGVYEAEWEYMDPRLSEPWTGRGRFTVGGGRIFELRMTLPDEARTGGHGPRE